MVQSIRSLDVLTGDVINIQSWSSANNNPAVTRLDGAARNNTQLYVATIKVSPVDCSAVPFINNSCQLFFFTDQTMTKTKQRYLSTRTLRTRTSLTDMSQEVKLRPPHRLNLDDLGPVPGAVPQYAVNPSSYSYRPQTSK